MCASPWTGRCAESAAQKQKDFFFILSQHFAEWDGDHDGVLSPEEIDVLISDPKISGKTAATVVALKEAVRNVKKWHLPPLNNDVLQQYARSAPGAQSDAPNFGQLYFGALKQIETVNHGLFSGGAPKLESFHQGRLGDCYFLAPLGAAVNRDGRLVQELIQQNADGSYEVNFKDGRSVHVPRLTDAEIAPTTMSSHKAGLWLNVLENAYSTVRNETAPKKRQANESIDMVNRGGSPGPVIKLFTGHAVDHVTIRKKGEKDHPPSDAQCEQLIPKLAEAIQSALDERRLLCCGVPGAPNAPGITTSHVYAILNFDPRAGIVEVWNPHGNRFNPKGPPGLENGYATVGGRFLVPLPQFVKIFGEIVFETKDDLQPKASKPR